ncbi:exo-poly-alpha-galacturonosidase [Pedobacter africanus]|uniref:Polygalacturonase n=1 Tax=Pedobacter africanus TaxID=151894 RepID=A0ACC6KW24_9SPHI|nr:glycoside hydrolase family 28 protein [Pedobacter africanus]MDR6783365.1 polygalacturonase [Pedobacter africanus]
MKFNKQSFLVLLSLLVYHLTLRAAEPVESPGNLIAPPNSSTATSVTLLWDKPLNYTHIQKYNVYLNGKKIAESAKTNYTATGLKPGTAYQFSISSVDDKGVSSKMSKQLIVKTAALSKIYNILNFGAKADDSTPDTKAVQKAIDACNSGGTVLVPKGQFIIGAIFLKSNMTLLIDKGGELKASPALNDYLPMVKNRFEGWELETYASLINAGKLDRKPVYNIENIAIRGEGKITGGSSELGNAMIGAKGIRSRGRLICIMNAKNVNVQGLTLQDSHCWTLHYIYSDKVTCHDLNIRSTAINGDGIDPDSSTDSYIFNSTFSTADDCIAIKSGKNPEGNIVARPTVNVRISDCKFVKGFGLAIGSEMSGGVKNVIIRDCEVGNLKEGIQIKSRKDRGGYVEDVYVSDCDLLRIKIETTVAYNSDGESAPALPHFRNLVFSNMNMSKAKANGTPISVDGFANVKHYTSNVTFKNVVLPLNAAVSLNYCRDIKFENVLTVDHKAPVYKITNSENIQK